MHLRSSSGGWLKEANDLIDVLFPADRLGRFQIDSGHSAGHLAAEQVSFLVRSCARQLRKRDVGSGDLVMYQGTQTTQAFLLFWASQWLGAIFCPIDHDWPDYAIARAAGALKPKLIVAPPARAGVFHTLFPDASLAETTVHPTGGISLEIELETLGDEDLSAAPALMPAESAAVYLFTSGSTAAPKVVVLSRRALLISGRLTRDCFEWQPGDRLLNLPEPHTMSGLRNAFVAAPLAEMVWCCSPTIERRSLVDVIDTIAASRCQRLVAAPALVGQLVLWGDRLGSEDLKHLKAIYTTGASLNVRDSERFYARFGIPVVNYYGLTETGGLCVSQRVTGWEPGDRTLGLPVGCEARLVAEDSSVDVRGELQIASQQLMTGYLNDAVQTAARFSGPWLRTGDIVQRDEQGRLTLVGRSDFFIKTVTTERVHPEEVEAVLEEHAGVAEAAVVGVMSSSNVERIAALVVLCDERMNSQALPKELADFVGARLGHGRTPSQIRFVATLPRSANGKLQRSRLPEMLA
jgi:acyl-coenzyme A synthetase/AMP-(fatty) acid ligase